MRNALFGALASVLIVVGLGAPAQAQFQASVYGGASMSNDSSVDVVGGGSGPSWSGDVSWDGGSFEMPPYYGFRGTYWLGAFGQPNWGIALDYVHNKVKADPLPSGVTTLEFTDGLNQVTLNGLYRFKNETAFTPYVGVGAGISIPHVEYQYGVGPKTFEYQMAGGVFQAMGGVDYAINDWLSVFGEYRASYATNEADLNGGGTLSADVFSHHVAVGLTYTFSGL